MLIKSSTQEETVWCDRDYADDFDLGKLPDFVRLDRMNRLRARKMSEGRISKKSIARWQSIVLSSLGKTLYPYSRYIRALDLVNLWRLLTPPRSPAENSK